MKEFFLLLCLWMLDLTPASELPCEDHLGLGQNTGAGNLTFKLRATSGNASHIRINGTNAWKPVVNGQNFIQINISQPVLLTSLRLDGERRNTSRVTGFVLQTSYDCSTYDSQNYSIQYLMMDIPITVPLKKVEYVKCLKIVPTNYTGSRAALRLDLIGCRVVKEETCQNPARPPANIHLQAHSKKLMFDQEITLAWVAVQLLSNTSVLRSYVQLNYNLDCNSSAITGYSFHHAKSSNITSDNQKSKWQILEFGYPIRVKCLYVMSSNNETIGKIYTNRCSKSQGVFLVIYYS
ncbi:uncharacterized protein LOC131949306 [Physella acuta]|uniref:uncharacterized protein LOC131949306 n=1 Tax=Physella acuta TaxID=109671 RepID=UPI0027DBD90F|nr:uncharacterized protein LOC131949306 [Physella acuta]